MTSPSPETTPDLNSLIDPSWAPSAQEDPVFSGVPTCALHGVAMQQDPTPGTDSLGPVFCPSCHEQHVRSLA